MIPDVEEEQCPCPGQHRAINADWNLSTNHSLLSEQEKLDE